MASLQGNRQVKGSAGYPPGPPAIVFNVSTVAQLQNAMNTANNAPGANTGTAQPVVINLADGTYAIPADLVFTSGNLTLQSASGNSANCIIQGDAMSASAVVGDIIHLLQNSNYLIQNLTLRLCGFSAIQIHGENGVNNVTMLNLVMMDTYQHMVKVSSSTGQTIPSQNGLLKNCFLGYTATLAPNDYTGGLDGHCCAHWEVVGNTFQNISSPGLSTLTPAEACTHFWLGGGNNLVHNNTFINCDRNIGFGLYQFANSASPNNTAINNMAYHSANGNPFIDVSISVEDSPNCQVGNNSIYRTDSYLSAIEYRGATAGLVLANNLTNKPLTARDGGTATLVTNVTSAQASYFVNPTGGNLHLVSGIAGVTRSGTPEVWVPDDFDSHARPATQPDIGADQFF
jgi:hypothetical protein